MNPRKRPAFEPLLPLYSRKLPRTGMASPCSSNQQGLLARWKKCGVEFGILTVETVKAVVSNFPYTSEDFVARLSEDHTLDAQTQSSEQAGPQPDPAHQYVDKSEDHHKQQHPLSTAKQSSIPSSQSIDTSSKTGSLAEPQTPHRNTSIEHPSSQKQRPPKYRHREHIYEKAHKANVKAKNQQLREEMQRQIYTMKRTTGFVSDFKDFQSLLDFQARLEKIEKQNVLSPSSSMVDLRTAGASTICRRHSSPYVDDMDFLRRAFKRAKATLDSPRPPQPFQPTFDQLRLSHRRKDQDIEQLLRPKVVPHARLPPEDDAQVDIFLSKRGIVSRVAREQVNDRDLSGLRPGQWLNDEVINFYGALILERSDNRKENPSKTGVKLWNVHYFSTFFWTKLMDGYEKGRLEKWTKKIDIFSKDVILIPINHHNAHWTSAAINFRRKRIESYDSMGTNREIVFKFLRLYLDAEHRNKKKTPFDFTGWQDRSLQEPLQENGYDCGVFTCQFMQGLSKGDEAIRFSQKDMPSLRRRMIWEIGNARLRDDP